MAFPSAFDVYDRRAYIECQGEAFLRTARPGCWRTLDDRRNVRITQSYHELARAIAAMTGSGANWCAFATWASKQAGNTIRGEDLQRAADDVLGSPVVRAALERVLIVAVRHAHLDASGVRDFVRRTIDPATVMRKASDAVSRGNLKVYAEIGHAFARWLEMCGAEAAPDGPANMAFRNQLRDGEPPDG